MYNKICTYYLLPDEEVAQNNNNIINKYNKCRKILYILKYLIRIKMSEEIKLIKYDKVLNLLFVNYNF